MALNRIKMSGGELYKLGYEAHYIANRLDIAYALYNKILDEFPNTAEAGYASRQVINITSKYPDIIPNIDEADVAVEIGL